MVYQVSLSDRGPRGALHESSGPMCNVDLDVLQGATHSNSHSHFEHWPRGRLPETAGARGAVIRLDRP